MISNDSPNAIIPKILTCSKEYTSNINNRLKLNTIFSDFEQTANSTFNKFITLSNARYKSVKYGNSLDSILQTQKITYKDLATEINENDIFINDNEISNEKKKLFKNNNLTKVKELNNLREQLRNTTKDITKFEKIKREKLKLKIEKKRMQIFNVHKPKTNKVHKSNKTNKKDKVCTEIEQQEEDNDIFVKQLLDHDKKYINKNMNRYFKYLDLLNELTPPGKKLPMKKDILNKMPSSNILPRYMNCLNYKEEKPIIIFTKKESKKDIDINKLTQYSKLAKAKSKKLNLTIPDNNNNKSKSKVILISRNNSECKNTIPFKGVNNEDAKFKTINIIKTNAEHYLNFKDTFIKKRNKINKDIGVNLPSLEKYEGISLYHIIYILF